uniref:Aspartokinase n=1 Tax=Candidatus Kentrum sp. TUN TaxID=2126343 RepID=A0A451A529_9GAMM|nr:MAG: aspartate kinase [Candidatus Kentron sp. TUN]VFK58611.1 MAG: aspartate kinase [Candidatus Kentron sp. TUN]VFK61138.1 MAG: aspartate kinase [Candidatus Kentron sp. TUN]
MTLIVQKYGGTSVGSVERIKRVAERVCAARQAGNDVVVVVSAMSGETDRLTELSYGITSQPNPRELDVLLATGEQITIALLSMALSNVSCPARSYTGGQVHIRTDNVHNKARIMEVEHRRVRDDLNQGRVVVIAGFQGIDEYGNITTLGRGGSDTTAVAMAAALQADECQIYTDVDGVYTSDPRIVSQARRLKVLAFEEMLELASLGAKVLQIRAVEFARKYNVPLRVLSSFEEGEGTLVTTEDQIVEQPLISGIAFSRDEAKLTVLGVPDRPGIAHAILGPIAEANIEVDMIVQNISQDGSTDFTFTITRNDYETAFDIVRRTSEDLQAREVTGDECIAKISLVGVGMRSHAGIASHMFGSLAKEGINIRMISTSEIKISVVVEEKYLELGVRVLHEAFGLEQDKNNKGANQVLWATNRP